MLDYVQAAYGLYNLGKDFVDGFGGDTRGRKEKEADKLAREQWEYEKTLHERNFQMQEDQFSKNFGLQQQNFEYQKGLQQTMMNREDNSVQRRVADLKAAGLSPVLAAGQGAGAGSIVSTTAPQGEAPQSGVAKRDLQVQSKMHQMSLRQAESQMALNAMTQSADIAHTKAETQRIKEETKHARERHQLDRDNITANWFHSGNYNNSILSENLLKHLKETPRTEIENNLKKLQTVAQRQEYLERQQKIPQEIAKLIADNQASIHDYELALRYGQKYGSSGSIPLQVFQGMLESTRTVLRVMGLNPVDEADKQKNVFQRTIDNLKKKFSGS